MKTKDRKQKTNDMSNQNTQLPKKTKKKKHFFFFRKYTLIDHVEAVSC